MCLYRGFRGVGEVWGGKRNPVCGLWGEMGRDGETEPRDHIPSVIVATYPCYSNSWANSARRRFCKAGKKNIRFERLAFASFSYLMKSRMKVLHSWVALFLERTRHTRIADATNYSRARFGLLQRGAVCGGRVG